MSLDHNKVYISTLDYYATGEGCTRIVYATRAVDYESFQKSAIRKIDGYFLYGSKIYINQVPIDDHVWDSLVTERMKSYFVSVIEGGNHDTGYFTHFVEDYVNFS